MVKSISIVDARRDLGRIADEVCRTGQAVVLTYHSQSHAHRFEAIPDVYAYFTTARSAGSNITA